MKLPSLTSLVCLSIALLSPSAVSALELGDPAPALTISEWVKGEPVNLADGRGKNIYVVEFWATWCGPCRVSIPHLSEMQAKFKDDNVTFIGVSDETVAKVEPFVKKMGEKMDYTVAVDKNRGTFASYMGAFNVGGIPHAFVVDKKGNLVWHGHPMAGLDKVLEKVIAGTFDMEAAKRAAQAEELLPKYFTLVATSAKSSPEGDKLGKQIVEYAGDNPQLLNQMAWIILTNPRIMHRDLELAMVAAKKAYDGTEGKDASVVDTYARALYDTGNVAQAIKMQKKAIEVCDEADLKAALEETLARYESKATK